MVPFLNGQLTIIILTILFNQTRWKALMSVIVKLSLMGLCDSN